MEFVLAVLNVIIIDIVLSGDNAIIIGMATKWFPAHLRKKIIGVGIAGATILRIIFSSIAVLLTQIIGLKVLGGVLLLYVVWKFYKELRVPAHQEGGVKETKTFRWAVTTILIADISLSLDNVLAVAGAAKENYIVLAIWLVFSILLMMLASNYIAKKLETYPQIQWLGLFIILFVAIEMLLSGTHEVSWAFNWINMMNIVFVVVTLLFGRLHHKIIPQADEQKIKVWIGENYFSIITVLLWLLLVMLLFGHLVHEYIAQHPAWLYFVILPIFLLFLELISIKFLSKKKASVE